MLISTMIKRLQKLKIDKGDLQILNEFERREIEISVWNGSEGYHVHITAAKHHTERVCAREVGRIPRSYYG
jgi:hypothetical protein